MEGRPGATCRGKRMGKGVPGGGSHECKDRGAIIVHVWNRNLDHSMGMGQLQWMRLVSQAKSDLQGSFYHTEMKLNMEKKR